MRVFPINRVALIGAIAQLVERLLCKQDVGGSNPSGSTQDARAKALPSASSEG